MAALTKPRIFVMLAQVDGYQGTYDLSPSRSGGSSVGTAYFQRSLKEMQLSDMLGGKKVDLRTSEDLSRYFRQAVVQEAVEQYGR